MAEVTRVHGDTIPSEQLGRDLEWVHVLASGVSLEDAGVLDSVRQAIDLTASVTIVGLESATDVMFGCEGVGATGAEMKATIEAAVSGITATVTIEVLTGKVFV